MGYFPERLVYFTHIMYIVNSFENAKRKSRWCTSNQTKAESHTEPGTGLRLTFNKPVSSVYSLLGVTWSWFCSFALLSPHKKKKKKKDSMPEFDSSLLYLMLKCSYLAILKISSELIKLTQNTLLHENFISTSYWAKFKNTDGSWLQPEHPAGCFFYEYPHITKKTCSFILYCLNAD